MKNTTKVVAMQDDKNGIHLRYIIDNELTQFVILESNVAQSTLDKLSNPERTEWFRLLDQDNNKPF